MSSKIKHLVDPQGEEEELIDHFDSLLKVAKLIGVTSTWWLRLFCIAWVSCQPLKAVLNASSYSTPTSWSFLVLKVPSVLEPGAIVVNSAVYAFIMPLASADFRGC